MYDPKDVCSRSGLEAHLGHIFNLKQAIFYFTNSADDLHIGALDDKPLDTLFRMQNLLDSGVLETGDGEEFEGYES